MLHTIDFITYDPQAPGAAPLCGYIDRIGAPDANGIVTGCHTVGRRFPFAPGGFLAGTLIATPNGAMPVEALCPGALVTTADGAALPVRWAGRSRLPRDVADAIGIRPLRILAGALAENLPRRDLIVAPGHALRIGEVLVQAATLRNGTTIAPWDAAEAELCCHHVELAGHHLLLAEGVAAESFRDTPQRLAFDNWATRQAAPVPNALAYPRATCERQLPPSIRATVAVRAALLRFPRRIAA